MVKNVKKPQTCCDFNTCVYLQISDEFEYIIQCKLVVSIKKWVDINECLQKIGARLLGKLTICIEIGKRIFGEID